MALQADRTSQIVEGLGDIGDRQRAGLAADGLAAAASRRKFSR
jgi:hypothetical protein